MLPEYYGSVLTFAAPNCLATKLSVVTFSLTAAAGDSNPQPARGPNVVHGLWLAFRMPLRTKLTLALLAIAVILVFPLGIALRSLQRVHTATAQIRDVEFVASLLLGRMRSGAEELRQAETALLFVPQAATRDRMSSELAALSRMVDSLGRFSLNSAAAGIRDAIGDIAIAAPLEYAAALDSQPARAESISTAALQPAMDRVQHGITVGERELRERTRARVDAAARETDDAQRAAAMALAVALLLTAAIAIWITRAISRPVKALELGMQAVAEGDFTHRLEVQLDRRDEFGRLAHSYRAMAVQLQELDKLKAEFVSVASHELKTPINVIQGYVQLFLERVYGELSPRQEDVCRTLQTQCRSLGRLVTQLLDVSRFEAGGGKLDPRPMKLGTFLDELHDAFSVLAIQRQVTFEVRRAPSLPEEVTWDQDRINEVLGNLLSNAFKFTNQGGRVQLDAGAEGDAVKIRVQDTGAGIPRSQLPHIFQKFYQADNQLSASAKGTGLGLAIAKEIVEAHAGTIVVDSVAGEGTTFELSLPIYVASPRRTSKSVAAISE